jgi:hypothetical protein
VTVAGLGEHPVEDFALARPAQETQAPDRGHLSHEL